MKYVRKWKLFESSKYEKVKEMVDTLHDISLEFIDNDCGVRIEPSNDIRIKLIALQIGGSIGGNLPLFIDIDVNRRIIAPDENRSGFGPLPDWFIERCRMIQSYMWESGFSTKVSIRYGVDWETLGSDEAGLNELSETKVFVWTSLIYKVSLEFFKR